MDRLVLLLGILACLGLALVRPGIGLGLAALWGTLGWWLRRSGQSPELGQFSGEVEARARAIARIYGATAVVFGHMHRASGRWEAGRFFGNSGTWAPMHHDPHYSIRVEESRPFLWLHSDATGSLSGGLCRFQEDAIVPVPGAYRRPLVQPLLGTDRLDTADHAPGGSFVPHSQPRESV